MPRACFATKADITENNTKADAKTIEQAGWPGHIDSDLRLCQAVKVAGIGLVSKTSWSLTEMENHGQSEALPASTLNIFWHLTEADQLASMVAHDFDQLRQALTRLGLCINNHEYRPALENFHVDSWNWQVLRDLTRLPQGFVGCWVWTSWAAYASARGEQSGLWTTTEAIDCRTQALFFHLKVKSKHVGMDVLHLQHLIARDGPTMSNANRLCGKEVSHSRWKHSPFMPL